MKLLMLTLPLLIAVASPSFAQNCTPTLQHSSQTYAVVTQDKPPPKQPKGRGEGRRDLSRLITQNYPDR